MRERIHPTLVRTRFGNTNTGALYKPGYTGVYDDVYESMLPDMGFIEKKEESDTDDEWIVDLYSDCMVLPLDMTLTKFKETILSHIPKG